MSPEDFARNLAHLNVLTKTASLPSWLTNSATLAGAGVGGAVGAFRGAQGSREGDKGYGALVGGLFGATSGAAAGYGLRTLVKTVPEGSKQVKTGKEALEKELKAQKIVLPENATGKQRVDYTNAREKYIETQRERMRDATQLATEGKHGKDATDAIDAVRKSYGAVGDIRSGREKLYGGLAGGLAGVGYGLYTLKGTKDLNAPTPEELNKRASLDPATSVAIHLGQLLAHF